MPRSLLAPGLLLCALISPITAQLKLSALFSDHLVLPHGKPCPVFGDTKPGETVTVRLLDIEVRGQADASGHFFVWLPAQPAGGPHHLVVKAGDKEQRVLDLHFGEVWICSGQSNMEWPLRESEHGATEIAAATDSGLRLFTVPNRVAKSPALEVASMWKPASPETVASFSAVGWFFARAVREKTGLAIGLIDATWGGTPVEAWMREEAFAAIPEADDLVARWKKAESDFDPAAEKQRFDKALAAWTAAAEAATKNGEAVPEKPRAARNPWDSPARPTSLWNGMMSPLLPYAISGCIWYQGESNESRAHQYRHLFSGMIQDWRHAFGQGDVPFLWVQLAGFRDPLTEPRESAWAELRDAQAAALSLPRTGQALAHDLGESHDIHPRNKQDVGRRLAIARERVLAGTVPTSSGPEITACEILGEAARLTVRGHSGPLRSKDGKPLSAFTIAGADRKFHPADATIEGDFIRISASAVPMPVAVRYAWADHPLTNLIDDLGLPLAPFRSDGWPGSTTRPE